MSGFLARWSRRSRRARRLPEPAADDAPSAADTADADAPPPDLPDIDDLGPDSDYRPFLQRSVAPVLRRLALRRLWRSDPAFGRLDGLNDYDEDFAALHRTGAEAVAAAVRAGRRYARDPAPPPESPAPDTPDPAQEAAADGGPPDPETAPERGGGADPPRESS